MTIPSSSPLSRARCLQHAQREAVGRCPDCTHFYCRECLIEHDGRMTCSRCLAERAQKDDSSTRPSWLFRVLSWCVALGAIGLAWGFFFIVGRILLFLRHDWKEMFL